MYNKTRNRIKFDDNTISQVWNKRKLHPWGVYWGYDKFNNIIKFTEYGKSDNKYGWDIDHSNPISNDGTDHLNNLQPLQSYYNRHIKSDNYPWGINEHKQSFKGLPANLKID